MHISINTDEGLSDLDKQILGVLAGGATAPAPAAKAPAAKKTAAPKTEKVEEPADDEPADDADEPAANTLEDAVALATKMVSAGDAAKVKAALNSVGAKKVSEVPEDKVDEFIAALG
jgi:hypothetical protein